MCASWPQSSQPVPNSSSVGGPEALDAAAAVSAANPKAMPGSSCAESTAIPVSQNFRRLMALCTTDGGSLLALRIVSQIPIVRIFRSPAVARGTLRETRSQCQLDPNSIAGDLCVHGFNAQGNQLPSGYTHLCSERFKRLLAKVATPNVDRSAIRPSQADR